MASLQLARCEGLPEEYLLVVLELVQVVLPVVLVADFWLRASDRAIIANLIVQGARRLVLLPVYLQSLVPLVLGHDEIAVYIFAFLHHLYHVVFLFPQDGLLLLQLHFGDIVFDVRQQALFHLLEHLHLVRLVLELGIRWGTLLRHLLASLPQICKGLVEVVDCLHFSFLYLLELCLDLLLLSQCLVLGHRSWLRMLDQSKEKGIVIIL